MRPTVDTLTRGLLRRVQLGVGFVIYGCAGVLLVGFVVAAAGAATAGFALGELAIVAAITCMVASLYCLEATEYLNWRRCR